MRHQSQQFDESGVLLASEWLREPICHHFHSREVSHLDILPGDLVNDPSVPDINSPGPGAVERIQNSGGG